MRKSLLGCVLLLGGIVSAGNLLPDASFELGGTDYDARRFADITDPRQQRNITPVADPEHPVHGKVSLRFDNPYRVPLGLRSPDIALRDDTTYTFSFYARSSKPVKLRALIFSVITRDETRRNGEWDNGNRKFFTLGKAWRRYSITFTPKKGFRWYFADLLWGEGSDATVWIDAMMLSPGKTPLPFAPKSEVEFALDSPRHCRIEGEPSLVCTLSGINYGTRGTEAEVVLREFDDYRETKLGERRWKGKLPPGGEVVRQNLPVERKEYGVYSLRGEFRTASGEQGTIWPYCYAVTGKYQPGTVDPAKDFLLGSEESFGFECPDINGGRAWYHLKGADFAEYNRLAANRGVRLLRLGNGIWWAFEWKSVEPERGKFDFRQADYLVDHARRQNNFILGVLGNNLLKRHLPEWALKRGKLSETFKLHGHPAVLPDLEDWRRYVAATVRHFKGRIFYWEIVNEANLTTAPEDYVKLLKIAFEECRKIDPSIKVVAPNVTGDHGGQMGAFLERFGKAGGFRYTDIVSFHPYSSREEGSPNPSRTAIDSIRRTIASFRKGLPLWNTELYYLYDNPPHPVDAGKGRAYHFIRRMLVDLGEGIRQETLLPDSMYFRRDRHPGYGYAVSRVVRHLIPSEHYVAGNAFARFLEGAVPVTRLETPRGVTLYLYRQRDGKPIAALWNYAAGLEFDITLPGADEVALFDLFGNPVKWKPELRVPRDPLYIKGKKDVDALIQALKRSRIASETGYRITRAGYFVKDGKPAVAVEFRSYRSEPQELRVRLVAAPGAKAASPGSSGLRLEPGKTAVILLPIAVSNGNRLPAGTVKVMVYDGMRTRTVSQPVEAVSLLRGGVTVRLGTPDRLTFGKASEYDPKSSSMEFSASADGEYFRLQFEVKDSRRGRYLPSTPWEMDGLELFFDRAPLSDMERREYTGDVFRLFLCPAAEGHPAFLKGQGRVDTAALRWQVRDTADGYVATLAIPWKELRLAPNSPVRFDVALDDNDGAGRRSQLTWSGTRKNHLHRNGFGIWTR